MKRRQAAASLIRTIIVLLTVSICVTQTKLSATSRTNKVATANFFEEKKPLPKEKDFKTQNVVKVYPDAIRRAMHVIARPSNEKQIDFLVFDINGNMEQKTAVTKTKTNKTKTKVKKETPPWVFTGTKVEQVTAANQQ